MSDKIFVVVRNSEPHQVLAPELLEEIKGFNLNFFNIAGSFFVKNALPGEYTKLGELVIFRFK